MKNPLLFLLVAIGLIGSASAQPPILSNYDTIPPLGDGIPEPSTYALFGIGAIGMLMVMRRKKTA